MVNVTGNNSGGRKVTITGTGKVQVDLKADLRLGKPGWADVITVAGTVIAKQAVTGPGPSLSDLVMTRCMRRLRRSPARFHRNQGRRGGRVVSVQLH